MHPGPQELDEEELAASRQRRRAKDDDGEMYDEFGRLKKSRGRGDRDAREVSISAVAHPSLACAAISCTLHSCPVR